MLRKRVLLVTSLLVGLVFLWSTAAICGTTVRVDRARQPAIQPTPLVPGPAPTQTPAIQKKALPKPVVQTYNMTIQNVSLTNKCQLKFILKNTGDILSVAQYKNSYVKVGANLPVSLATFDPSYKLRMSGRSKTSINNEPLKKDTNIQIQVILFNGKKIFKQQMLKPTCPAPEFSSPMQLKPKSGVITKPLGSMTAKSGDSPLGKKLITVPSQKIHMPETILQVERLGGDLQTWDSWAGTDTSMQRMDFRWKTEIESLQTASWQAALSPDFPYIIAEGSIASVPPKGTYGQFSIDLSGFSGTYTKPATFFVRVKPLKLGVGLGMITGSGLSSGVKTTELDPSTSVRLSLVEAGSSPVTEFHLPETHLKVVFQKILLVDDSDELSGGDMAFKFTVNGEEKWKTFSTDEYDSGEMINLNDVTFIITDPPNFTGISIMGCDNDDTSGDFTAKCGNDPDTAIISDKIFTGKKMGQWKMPKTSFALNALGLKLLYKVHGYYEMYCDPCP